MGCRGDNRSRQRILISTNNGGISLRPAVLAADPTGTALGETVLLPDGFYCLSAPFGAYKFSEAPSLSTCFSSDRSATSRLRRRSRARDPSSAWPDQVQARRIPSATGGSSAAKFRLPDTLPAPLCPATSTLRSDGAPFVCTENLIPDKVVVKAAKDRKRTDDASALHGPRERRIFV